MPDLYIFFLIAASAAYIPADDPNGIKTLLANGVSPLFINGNLAVIDDLRKLKNSLSCIVLL